jgi:hypothetical protein
MKNLPLNKNRSINLRPFIADYILYVVITYVYIYIYIYIRRFTVHANSTLYTLLDNLL